MTPIATATNTPGTPIKVGRGPQAIAITPDGKTAYVANTNVGHGDADHDRDQHGGQADQGRQRAVDDRDRDHPDGKTAYVVSFTAGTVTPIATATNTPGKPIKVGKRPFALVIAP